MDQLQPVNVDQERNSLRIFSILFLVLAAIEVGNLIFYLADRTATMAELLALGEYTESMLATTNTVVIVFSVLSILVLLFLGVMGLRQAAGKDTGSSHIVIAKLCLVVLVLAFIGALYTFFSSPVKDWVDLGSSFASVCIGMTYIRSAKAVKEMAGF